MAKFLLRGNEYDVPEMNFIAVERAWPYIDQATLSLDPMEGTAAALAIIAAAIMEAEDFDPQRFGILPSSPDNFMAEVLVSKSPEVIHLEMIKFFKKKLKASEISHVKNCMFDVLREAGMEAAEPGEVDPAEEAASPSTETLTDTSPSLLPPELKVAAGIVSESAGVSDAIT